MVFSKVIHVVWACSAFQDMRISLVTRQQDSGTWQAEAALAVLYMEIPLNVLLFHGGYVDGLNPA